MRFVRFDASGPARWGIIEGEHVRPLKATPWQGINTTGEDHRLSDLRLLAPATPSKIIAVGLNYRDHAAELGLALPDEPLLFLKPPTCVVGPGQAIVAPRLAGQVDYEAELAVVVKRRCRQVSSGRAGGYLLGYTCANDVTARDLQRKDGQWARAKSFDTFCPLGPWIETDVDTSFTGIRCFVNGERRQDSTTAYMLYSPAELLSFISHVMTLEPGDVILTGTPAGIGPLRPGDTCDVEIEGIGRLSNPVQADTGNGEKVSGVTS